MKRLVINPIFCFLLITTLCFVAMPAMAVIVDIKLSATYTVDDPNTLENEKEYVIKLTYSDEPDPKPIKNDFTFKHYSAQVLIDYPNLVLFDGGSDNDPKTYFITFRYMPRTGIPIFIYKDKVVMTWLTSLMTRFLSPTDLTDIGGTSVEIPNNTIQVELLPPIKIEGVDGLTRSSRPDNTEDITYTLRITNTSDASDKVYIKALHPDRLQYNISPAQATLAPGTSQDVILTLPRLGLILLPNTYRVTVYVESENNDDVVASVLTETTITAASTPTNPINPTLPGQETPKVIFSEFMFESEGGTGSLPQWIEVHNSSLSNVNLRGWKLSWKRLQPSLLELTTTFKEDFIIPSYQSRLIVSTLGRHSRGINLSDDSVYQLHVLHAKELAQDDIANHNRLITRGGFSLKLLDSKDELIDHIGTLEDGKQTWQFPVCLIDGVRSSLIRRFDEGVPRPGIEKRGWYRAFDAKHLAIGLYYGGPSDLGTPGYRFGKPLPVELSQFSAKFVKDEVVINWTTESELNNAGFNILRSPSPTQNFRTINPKLIQGAGTTGQRTQYQFIDKTAKPDVAYYYRLEDVDLAGTRGIITTYRLRGAIGPTGKLISTWGTLKDNR